MTLARFKWYAAHAVGAVVVLAALAYIARPSPHIPLYDANLVRLAETERQGYCAGVIGWRTQFAGDAAQARQCRKEHPEESGAVNLIATERGFCRGIIDKGWEGTVPECIAILEGYQYWPTLDGSLTDQWNRARPYPKPAISGTATPDSDSRTGEHQGPSRSESGYGRP